MKLHELAEKPGKKSSGYACCFCHKDIPYGKGHNFPVSSLAELERKAICLSCRSTLVNLVGYLGYIRMFPIGETVSRLKSAAAARVEENLALVNGNGKAKPAPDRKRNKRLRDKAIRSRMKGQPRSDDSKRGRGKKVKK